MSALKFLARLWAFIFCFGVTTMGGLFCCLSFVIDGPSLAASHWERNLLAFALGAVMVSGGVLGMRKLIDGHFRRMYGP